MTEYSPEQAAALGTARALASLGIPVFVAQADPSSSTGYALPRDWQNARPDPGVVDRWQPGMAIAAVMGQGLDVIDVDPRNGGDPAALNGRTPVSYGVALTPSGGVHSFIRSLGVRKKTNLLPGIDLQAGAPDGSGRGFVFLAPTVRVSKATGQPVAYQWAMPLDLARWQTAGGADLSGLALAELVRTDTQAAGAPSADEFMKTGPWANVEATLAEGRNNGVARLAAGLRGRGGWREDDAIRYLYAEVWPLIDQEQGGHSFSTDEFEATIRAQFRQYPDGGEQRAAEAATPPMPDLTGAIQPPSAARYFGEKNVFQASTLARDVASLGPLAQGRDDTLWAYRSGVWRQDKHVVRNRSVFLLGERYRPAHKGNAGDIVLTLVPPINCDPLPDLVNVRNGLLDWRTGELRGHAPEVLSTVQLNVDWDPGAQCPAFEKFLSEVVPPDVVESVWELLGYLMYSGNPLHKAVMLTGTGRNGKGTFLHVVEELLGRANITTVTLHSLVTNNFAPASLFGKLANIAGDIDPTYVENTAILKSITGGDTISAEHKFRDRFDFRPWAVPVFSANKIPGSADTTVGYLSRWLIVNFPHDFTGRENRRLGEQLSTQAELSGIAAKGIAALPRLLERGDFLLTESAIEARDEFVRRVDQVRTWLHDCAELADDAPWQPRTELYQAYQRWAVREGHRIPIRAAEFYDRIEAAGAVPAKVHGTRGYNRVRVIDAGHIFSLGAAGAASTTQAEPAPAPTYSPVNTGVSEGVGAGGAGSPHFDSYTRAPTRAHETKSEGAAPSAPKINSEAQAFSAQLTATLLAKRGGQAAVPAETKPKRAKVDPEERAAVKAAAKAEARLAKIAAAAGALFELPAVVTRDGAIRPIGLAAAGRLLREFGAYDAMTVDVETTGYPIGHADYALRTIQLGNEHVAVVFDAGDQEHLGTAGFALAGATVLHAHSATADLIPLAVAGVAELEAAWDRMQDTVIPAKLLDPGSTGSDPGLKQLAPAVLSQHATVPAADAARAELFKAGGWLKETNATTPAERNGWANVDPRSATMIRYAASDVLDTAALARVFYGNSALTPGLLERERTAQRMTARVAHRGIRIDGAHVDAKLPEHRAALAEAAVRLAAFGIGNPGSDQQVAAKLLELGAPLSRTKTGRPSVARGVLDPLAKIQGAVGDLVRARLDYQHHETVLGLFLEPYAQLVHRGDGRARPTVYTLGADTGRMSCVRPNLQQVPRQGGIRACVTADPGQLLVSADFASVEIRVAAALSGDANLQAMLAAGVDLHWEIARQVYGPEASKEDRYNVKRGVFGRLYGSGIPGIARTLAISESEAASMVDTLDAMTPQLTAWSRSVSDAVKAGHTQFPSYSGRTIHLPKLRPHAAPNYAIQGTARELLVDTLLRWRDTRWGEAVLLPVHDEVLLVIDEAEAADATAVLVAAMETELYGVPIKAEASEPSYVWKDAS